LSEAKIVRHDMLGVAQHVGTFDHLALPGSAGQCSIGARCRPERPAGQNEGGTHPSNFKPSDGTQGTTTSRIVAKPSGSIESLIS
jgi:hypothetical protein